VGWLLLGLGLSLTWSDVLDGYVHYGELARPGSLPAARYLAVSARRVHGRVGLRRLRAAADPQRVAAVAVARLALVSRALGAAPVAFLVTVALLPEPLHPPFESVPNPLGLPGGLLVQVPLIVVNLLAGAVVLLTVPVAAVSLALRFAAHTGWNASSCAGWRSPRAWPRWARFWCWPAPPCRSAPR
jgi:hypothetical protein